MLCLEPMGFIWIRPSMGSPQNPGCPKVVWWLRIAHRFPQILGNVNIQQARSLSRTWTYLRTGTLHISFSDRNYSWYQVAPLNGSSLDMASGRRESTGGFPIFRRSSLKLETWNFLTSTPTTAFRLQVSMTWHDPKLINSPPHTSVWPWNPKVCHCLLQRMTRSIFNWKQCDPAPCIVGTLQRKCVGVFVAYILPPKCWTSYSLLPSWVLSGCHAQRPGCTHLNPLVSRGYGSSHEVLQKKSGSLEMVKLCETLKISEWRNHDVLWGGNHEEIGLPCKPLFTSWSSRRGLSH